MPKIQVPPYIKIIVRVMNNIKFGSGEADFYPALATEDLQNFNARFSSDRRPTLTGKDLQISCAINFQQPKTYTNGRIPAILIYIFEKLYLGTTHRVRQVRRLPYQIFQNMPVSSVKMAKESPFRLFRRTKIQMLPSCLISELVDE